MSVLLIDPFSSGTHYHQLLQNAEITYYAVRTQRALESGLSGKEPVPSLVFDNVAQNQISDLAEFCREHNIDSVITGAESGVPLAEALKAELGLGSTAFTDQGKRFWDKAILYSRLQEAKVRVPGFVGVFTADDVDSGHHLEVLAGAAYPVVVKPSVGAGSVGVHVVKSQEQANEAIKNIVMSPGFFGGEPPQALVQELVKGREYVIDTVSQEGHHRIVAVCTYDKHPSSNGTMVYDRLRWLPWGTPKTEVLARYARNVLDALDHWHGSVHMEVILDDDGPCLIDLGVRPHGAGHPLKTHVLTGTSQLHEEVATVVAPHNFVESGYHLDRYAAIEFLSLSCPSVIREDANPEQLLHYDYVISGEVSVRPGLAYPETHSLLDSESLGIIFISGKGDQEIFDNSAHLRQAFSAMVEESNYEN